MDGWTISIEAVGAEPARPGFDDAIERFLDALADRGGAVSARQDRTGYGATFSLDASTTLARSARSEGSIDAATTWGLRHFRAVAADVGLPEWPIVHVEVMTYAEHDAALATPNFPELVGVAEIAELLGVSRARSSQLQATTPGFPQPVATLAAGPVWTRISLDHFLETWERRPGRPAKAS